MAETSWKEAGMVTVNCGSLIQQPSNEIHSETLHNFLRSIEHAVTSPHSVSRYAALGKLSPVLGCWHKLSCCYDSLGLTTAPKTKRHGNYPASCWFCLELEIK